MTQRCPRGSQRAFASTGGRGKATNAARAVGDGRPDSDGGGVDGEVHRPARRGAGGDAIEIVSFRTGSISMVRQDPAP